MYFLPIRLNHNIIMIVKIYPIISYPINQRGPLIPTGKKVAGDIQFRKKNPENIEMIPSRETPTIYILQRNDASSAT